MDKNSYKKFTDVQIGDSLSRPVLVSSIKEAIDKNGNTFVKITMKDGFSEVTPMMFKTDKNMLEQLGVCEESVADVKISVSEYNGGKSFRVDKIAPNNDPEITPGDFIKLPPHDTEKMFGEICELIEACANDCGGKYKPISELALRILHDKKERYITSSAAVSMHHNMKGGLIYHSYRMVKTANAVCDIYEKLDRELLVCGAALHDIGKIWEYKTSSSGEAEFTPSGVLFGHLYLGASLIKKYTEGESYSTERVQLLTHLLLSHHGTREFGAVVCPATPEAFALFYIDNLDAKLYVCEDAYDILDPGTITEKKPFGLDNRLYRPREF